MHGVRLRNIKTGLVSERACEGVFVAIGHTPVTELVAGQLPLDGEGYVVTRPDSTATAIPGVFAAGDVKDKVFRQAVGKGDIRTSGGQRSVIFRGSSRGGSGFAATGCCGGAG